MRTEAAIILVWAFPAACSAQAQVAYHHSVGFRYHAERALGPAALAARGVEAGYLQMTDNPAEWGQGAGGYARRAGSGLASSGIRGVLAWGLDSALHQDPRYYRSLKTGFWRRTGHALRGTILTRTDSGGETLAVWRIGSAYGASYLSSQWYPDRFHTTRHYLIGGSTRLGFDLARNVTAEFWPDLKKKLARRKP